MKTTIYYCTGTGNSLWAARKLAAELKEAKVASMRRSKPEAADAEAIGLAFPVHVWGLPSRVIDFVNKLPVGKSKYYFALGVNAGQVAGTLNQLKKLMAARGLTLNAGYDIAMPSNYIPWGGAEPIEKQEARFAAAAKKLKDIAGTIEGGKPGPVEKGPLWQRMFLSGIAYKFTFNKLAQKSVHIRIVEPFSYLAMDFLVRRTDVSDDRQRFSTRRVVLERDDELASAGRKCGCLEVQIVRTVRTAIADCRQAIDDFECGFCRGSGFESGHHPACGHFSVPFFSIDRPLPGA